jgi:tellurite resistance protein TerC
MLAESWINQWIDKNVQVAISLGVILVCIWGSIFYSIFMAKKGLPPDATDDNEIQDHDHFFI